MIYSSDEDTGSFYFAFNEDGHLAVYELREKIVDGFYDGYDSVERKDATIMRFIGVLDKNGIEIYEKDIVRNIGIHVHTHDKYPIGPELIEYPFVRIEIVSIDYPYIPILEIGDSEPDIEILGNIYENQDLLPAKV